jgi:hypothetical protein
LGLIRKSAVTFVIALFFLVAGSMELSNLIWKGLEGIELLALGYLETFPILENK